MISNFKQRVARSFSRAANTYDQHAALQHEIEKRLIQRLSYTKINPDRILNLGSGTGNVNKELQAMFPQAEIISLDMAEGMLQHANQQQNSCRIYEPRTEKDAAATSEIIAQCEKNITCMSNGKGNILSCCADAEALPFLKHSVDLVFSNLMLQWIPSLSKVFFELHNILKPKGLLLFTTFGPDTLCELKHSWSQVDANEHVNNFFDLHLIGDAMLNAKLADPVTDAEHITLTYAAVFDLLRELKLIGASVLQDRLEKPYKQVSQDEQAKQKSDIAVIKKMVAIYEAGYKNNEKIPATFEVVYGQAWGAELINRQGKDALGNVYVPLESVSHL